MSHYRPSDRKELTEPVNQLVIRALSSVRPHFAGAERKVPLTSYLKALEEAALAPTPGAMEDVIAQLQRTGRTTGQILELYIGGVARQLGEAWLADRLNFAAVTIGSARLQSMARRLDRLLPSQIGCGGGPVIMVAIPKGEQHVLGGMVLSTLLRERGLAVHLESEATPDKIRRELCRQPFFGVFLTASGEGQVENLTKLVDCIRCESPRTPIVLGGAILEQIEQMDLKTGADLATSDLDAAMRHCADAAADAAVPLMARA
ncbi:MAG: hypothetical protein P1U53_10705 [Sulfitobacter sp.]|nr:hypothetical protein [Sulfitobacter sp.]